MKTSLSFLVLAAVLGACAPAPQEGGINDPYETTNRKVHAFNKSVDENVFGAFGGDGTGAGISPVLTDRVVRFAQNTGGPSLVLNGILQGDVEGASVNTMRFLLNTTVGVLGLFDPAAAIGLPEQDTDFGETLAVWGVPEGAYLELPVLGPSTERRLAGRIIDWVINPLDKVGTVEQKDYGTIAKIGARVIKAGDASGAIDSVLNDSADSYAALRLIYLQNRRDDLGTTPPEDAVDPYDDLYGDQ